MAELEDNGWQTWPNAISVLRGIAAVIVVVLIARDQIVAALIVFVVFAASDFVDGWLAKNVPGQSSKVGKIIDPITDKMLVVFTLAGLATALQQPQVWLAFLLVLTREIIVFFAKKAKAAIDGAESAAQASRFSMLAQCASTCMLFLWVLNQEMQASALVFLWIGVGASMSSSSSRPG